MKGLYLYLSVSVSLGIAGGYYDGPRAYNLQIQFLISPTGRSEWDKNFYELAWKAHTDQGPLPNNCAVSDFEKPVDAFIELILCHQWRQWSTL